MSDTQETKPITEPTETVESTPTAVDPIPEPSKPAPVAAETPAPRVLKITVSSHGVLTFGADTDLAVITLPLQAGEAATAEELFDLEQRFSGTVNPDGSIEFDETVKAKLPEHVLGMKITLSAVIPLKILISLA